ncbi:hypothetical protein ACET3Z_007980 [Daucus carota]
MNIETEVAKGCIVHYSTHRKLTPKAEKLSDPKPLVGYFVVTCNFLTDNKLALLSEITEKASNGVSR